jgi:drug/metabolite transporter (DMT)-like permease
MHERSSLMGVSVALALCVDRGRYLFRQHPPSRRAWVWLALSVLCTIIGPLLLMR